MKTIPVIHSQRSRFCRLPAFALALALGSAGCIIVPAPGTDSGNTRVNVDRHTPERFAPGKTTRADVMLALGEPDAVSSDERQLAYRREKITGYWISLIVLANNDVNGGEIYQQLVWVWTFDAAGHLEQISQTNDTWAVVDPGARVRLHTPSAQPGDSNSAPAGPAEDPVWRTFPDCSWLHHRDGVRLGGVSRSVVAEPGILVLTESNLFFKARAQFANTGPELKLPLASIAALGSGNRQSVHRLTIRTRTGEIHIFVICGPNGYADKPATKAANDFIQSKIKPSP